MSITSSDIILNSIPATKQPQTTIQSIEVNYKGKLVQAKRLSVRSIIDIDLERAWANVQTPALLQYVAKGMISFAPLEGSLPKVWKLGETYAVKMRIGGILPIGGVHYLNLVKVDDATYSLSTKEWDKSAKIWNHDVCLTAKNEQQIIYEDAIVIYAGWLTPLVVQFAKRFYIHRQQRWKSFAQSELDFTK